MLKNELKDFEELFSGFENSGSVRPFDTCPESHFKKIRQAWEEAYFSDISEQCLMRYFNYHLEGIAKLSDKLFVMPHSNHTDAVHNSFLALIDYLRKHHSPCLDLCIHVPIIYHKRLINQLSERLELIRNAMQTVKIRSGLKTCLLNWLNEFTNPGSDIRYSYRSLNYFEDIIYQLFLMDWHSDQAEDLLVATLCNFNFNDLSFFVYHQETIREVLSGFTSTHDKLNYLQVRKAHILSSTWSKNLVYDSSWPALKTMLSEWLQEEICLAELVLRKEAELKPENMVPKLPLEMSVAHLACFIRLLFEENVFATSNLKLIFKCFSGHYQTKRQSVISPGSLSKEFYSIDQHTAARVRDLLQKMILRINRNFFPVWVATGVIILSYSGTH